MEQQEGATLYPSQMAAESRTKFARNMILFVWFLALMVCVTLYVVPPMGLFSFLFFFPSTFTPDLSSQLKLLLVMPTLRMLLSMILSLTLLMDAPKCHYTIGEVFSSLLFFSFLFFSFLFFSFLFFSFLFFSFLFFSFLFCFLLSFLEFFLKLSHTDYAISVEEYHLTITSPKTTPSFHTLSLTIPPFSFVTTAISPLSPTIQTTGGQLLFQDPSRERTLDSLTFAPLAQTPPPQPDQHQDDPSLYVRSDDKVGTQVGEVYYRDPSGGIWSETLESEFPAPSLLGKRGGEKLLEKNC